jgi:Uncharacterized protein conserved in bacteria with the myosin-like domain
MYLIDKVLNRCHPEMPDGNPGSKSGSFIEINALPSRESFKFSQQLSPTNGSFFMAKMDNDKKQLFAKLEELENENTKLTNELKDSEWEKEGLKSKIAELNQELAKKDEELKKLVSDKINDYEKLKTLDAQEELENELKLKDFKISELNKMIEELNQKHEMDISNLKVIIILKENNE